MVEDKITDTIAIKTYNLGELELSNELLSCSISGQWRSHGRRDSRPLLSPEQDGGSRSREGSPSLSGGGSRGVSGRRSSGEDSCKGGGSSTSREHSPQGNTFISPVIFQLHTYKFRNC